MSSHYCRNHSEQKSCQTAGVCLWYFSVLVLATEGYDPVSSVWASVEAHASQVGGDHWRFARGFLPWQVEKESNLAVQCLGSVLHLTPKKNTCVFRSCPVPAICSSSAHAALAQQQEQGVPSEPFQQQAAQVRGTLPHSSFPSLFCHAECFSVKMEDGQYFVFYPFLQHFPSIFFLCWSKRWLTFYLFLRNIGVPLHRTLVLASLLVDTVNFC